MIRRVVVPVLGVWMALIAIAVILVARRGDAQTSTESRTLSTDLDAAGLRAITLHATDGPVEVIGADEDRITITTHVSLHSTSPHWLEQGQADLAKAELVGKRHGEGFSVRVSRPGAGAMTAAWTVRVPRRFAVDVDANRGTFVIADVSGGVKVRATAGGDSTPGSIRVNVPGGPLDLSLGVGEIRAQTALAAQGPADVSASVGNAQITLAGREIVSPRAPGPGHRLRLDGTGPDAMKLRVGVGTAVLDIR